MVRRFDFTFLIIESSINLNTIKKLKFRKL